MNTEEKTIAVEKLNNAGETMIIDVPDDVYITKSGKLYFSKPTRGAIIKMDLQEAIDKGYNPSKEYQKFVEDLYNKQKNKI